MSKIVVGLFDHSREAEAAVAELTAQGFRSEDISFAKLDGVNEREREMEHDATMADGAATGATGGALLGGLGGLLLGLGLFAIPGLGPLAAAGPLVAVITGAGVGAGLGGVIGALTEAGVPEEEAEFYVEGIKRGGSLVTVHVAKDRDWTASDILRRHGAVDVEQRREEWNQGGAPVGNSRRAETATSTDRAEDFIEESDRRERAVASSATLERPAAASSRIPEDVCEASSSDVQFQEHYRQTFSHSGKTLDELKPAYEFGYHAATDPRFIADGWEAAEASVRQDWSTRGQGAWDDISEAVRFGWENQRRGAIRPDIRTAGMPAMMAGGMTADTARDARGPLERAEDDVTGDQFDERTGKRI